MYFGVLFHDIFLFLLLVFYFVIFITFYLSTFLVYIQSSGTFENGKSFKYKMNIYQEKYDIFAMQGTVRSINVSHPSVQIPITYGITEIQNPIYYEVNSIRTLYGACYMEIDNGNVKERRMIANYDPTLKYGTDDSFYDPDNIIRLYFFILIHKNQY